MNELIIKRIYETCTKYPTNIACVYEDCKITYSEFWDLINYYGNLLKRQGTTPVIVFGDNSIDNLMAIFACIIANRAYIPIGSCMPINRLQEIINVTSSTLILSDMTIDVKNCECIQLYQLKKYSTCPCKTSKNDIAYIIFTSGSTGEPKGVPISYSNLNNFIMWISNFEILEQYKNIKVMNTASFSFDLSVADIFYSICNGNTLCILSDRDDLNIAFKFMEEKQIDLIVATPTLIKLYLLDEAFNCSKFKHLKCIYMCGERLDSELARKLLTRFPNLCLINAYGPTEATSAVSGIIVDEYMLDDDILPVGKIDTCACSLSIKNDEIVIKGASVFAGYLNTQSSKVYKDDDSWVFRTGDIGFILDGLIYCKGRNDDQIKYKGYRIELNDIESNLLKIDGVLNAAVVPSYNGDGLVKSIKAFIVLKEGLDSNYVKAELSKMIPKYMMPKIKVLDELPINKNGKIDRKELIMR